METLAVIVIIFIWCLFGGFAWVLLKGESFGFRFTAWFISGFFWHGNNSPSHC